MAKLRAVDKNHVHTMGYLRTVFIKGERTEGLVPWSKWIWLTTVEIIVGSELLESIVNTASVVPPKKIKRDDSSYYGDENNLNSHIPSGFVNNFFRGQIVEVLYYKYYLQYLIFEMVGEPIICHESGTLDCTRVRFRAKKGLFYQYIALRRIYELSWLFLNIFVDLAVFFCSRSVEWVIVSAISIEAIRRFLKI